ncbi:MAG: hypothetical protein U5R48_01315 [Gammaproteobacteria bacterium]|nr:hypothetical protein [Gammaproteobacteria bacterium]
MLRERSGPEPADVEMMLPGFQWMPPWRRLEDSVSAGRRRR